MYRDRDPASSSVTSTPVAMSAHFATDDAASMLLSLPDTAEVGPGQRQARDGEAIVGAVRASILALQMTAVTTCMATIIVEPRRKATGWTT